MAYNEPTFGESGEVYTDNVRNSLAHVKSAAEAAQATADNAVTSIIAASQAADEALEKAAAAEAFVQSPTDDRIASLVEDSASATATALSATYGSVINVATPDSGLSTALIQAAIDQGYAQRAFGATTVHIVGVHEVDVAQASVPGIGGVCLDLKEGVYLTGPGTIKLADGAGAGSGAIIANTSATITDAGVVGLTIDGNFAGNPTSGFDNACLYGASGCRFDKVTSVNAGHVGLMMRDGDGGRNWVTDCLVTDCENIGIQCQKNPGIVVRGNQVYNCGDNGIDIEGNDTSGAGLGIGERVVITGNIVDGCLNGVFLESTGQAIVQGNFFYSVGNGVILNRINTGAYEVLVSGNVMKNQAGDHGNAGVYIINTSGKALVTGNTFDGFTYGLRGEVAEFVVARGNVYRNIDLYLVSAESGANKLLKSLVADEVYEGAQSNGFPKTVNDVGDSRLYLVNATSAWSLESGAVLRDTYYYKTTNTTLNGAWGARAIYFGGETIVYITANIPAAGEYVTINGADFYVRASAAGEVKLGDPATQAAGDYTATVNGDYPVYVYHASEFAEYAASA